MENLSHTLVGYAMGRAGLDRLTPMATPALIIAANLPDIDAVSLFWGQESYFKYHRGITHSYLGILIFAFALTVAMFAFDKLRRIKKNPTLKPISPMGIFIVSLLGLASHLFMDYTTTYGVRPWLPWSGHWYYGDMETIADPWIWLILGCGIAADFAGSTAKSGITARKSGRTWALASLGVLTIYWAGLFMLHSAALNRLVVLERRLIAPQEKVSLGALPAFANPFAWRCIIETPVSVATGREMLLEPAGSPITFSFFNQPQIPEIMARIAGTSAGKTFLDFARFKKIDVKNQGDLTEVVLQDLRFGLTARFLLDKSLNVLSARFSRPRIPFIKASRM